ncbi:NAD(P)/FAD-dependent oxidoreductase [Epibacterium ulvae]|uniref:NAD(P)/FAD-dependent oxidoreductase n=1 Tax=Epibacterium ulvae TaxID=1156985 RepID=UPI001BFC5CC1|nr:FAD/NAD(P)-binding oxidoreductase [Epibacterium ulvae]MBT8154184.1 NAD(P)/FAD-dependent oxidoreductase [Epibacterium ulvae]
MSPPQTLDVLIICAGPAGLSAASVLAEQGLEVHVVDRENAAGGIPRHCGHSPYGWREFRRIMGGQNYARRLIACAQNHGAHIHTRTTVVALHPQGSVDLSTPTGLHRVQANRVLIATGVRETSRAARFIGGTKPGGVMNTGALQGLVYLAQKSPFKRPIILGSELVSFSALMTCRHSGARPVAMVEPNANLTTYGAARWPPRVLGIPVHLNTQITAIHGRDWVTGVTLKSGETERRIACDAVVITGAFRPKNALLRASHLVVDPSTRGPEIDQFGRCSDPVYFAATQGQLPDPAPTQTVRAVDNAIAWHTPQRIAQTSETPSNAAFG